jgi:hypothetical protein
MTDDKEMARKNFNEVREQYWVERLKRAQPHEFNLYNQARMRAGKAPIGPDSFPVELEHRKELANDPRLALQAENLWEIFRRQHDFQHGSYAFRWHMGSEPRSPHDANLPRQFGEPNHMSYWP